MKDTPWKQTEIVEDDSGATYSMVIFDYDKNGVNVERKDNAGRRNPNQAAR